MSKQLKIFAFVIISVATILAYTSIWNDSLIVDEIPHVGSGYSYVTTQDYRLNPEHPPLAKDLAGWMMSLFLDVDGEPAYQSTYWTDDVNGQWNFGRKLIYNSGNDVDAIVRTVKIPMLLFFVLSAIYVFKWTRELYGDKAGKIALVLFAFSPTVIANSRFVTTDIPALFGVLLASYYFFKYLKDSNRKNLIIAGVAFGIAQLLKFSVFLLVPYFLLIALIYIFVKKDWKVFLMTILIMVIGFIGVVWPWYGWHVQNYDPVRQHSDTEALLATYGNRNFADPVVFLSDKPYVRGLAQYGLGLLMVNQRVIGGNTVYFLGKVERFGNALYFPIVYFIKESLAFWGLLAIALFYLFRQAKFKASIWRWTKEHFIESMMIVWLIIYWTVSIRGSLNIGVRHLLPVYPFTIILTAGLLAGFLKKNAKPKLLIIAGLLGWYVFETVHIHPFYLTYFNQVAGGPSGGHRLVVDSNLDWGQDLKRLAHWVEDNNVKNIHLDYFGWADQSYYLGSNFIWTRSTDFKSKEDFLRANPDGGYLAVSASFYMGTRGEPDKGYAWLDEFEPVTVIGNSIFVWKF